MTDPVDQTDSGADHESSRPWQRRGTYCEPRLSDVVEMYEDAGFEVRLEPFSPEDVAEHECAECMLSDPGRYQTIFTRKKATEA